MPSSKSGNAAPTEFSIDLLDACEHFVSGDYPCALLEVKPWFRGKLDFSPRVPDLTAQGYELSCGRLDYLTDRPVSALVYFRHDHAINVFSWPAKNDGDETVRRLARQGFHLRSWQRSGMTYWAISELNDQELDEFVQLFQEYTSQSNP